MSESVEPKLRPLTLPGRQNSHQTKLSSTFCGLYDIQWGLWHNYSKTHSLTNGHMARTTYPLPTAHTHAHTHTHTTHHIRWQIWMGHINLTLIWVDWFWTLHTYWQCGLWHWSEWTGFGHHHTQANVAFLPLCLPFHWPWHTDRLTYHNSQVSRNWKLRAYLELSATWHLSTMYTLELWSIIITGQTSSYMYMYICTCYCTWSDGWEG